MFALGLLIFVVFYCFFCAWDVFCRKEPAPNAHTIVTFLNRKVGNDCTRFVLAFLHPVDTAKLIANLDLKICKHIYQDKIWTPANMFVRLAAANHFEGVSYFLKDCDYATVVSALEIACIERHVDIVEYLLCARTFSEFSLFCVSFQLAKNISLGKNCQTCGQALNRLESFCTNSHNCILMASLLGIGELIPQYRICNMCLDNTKLERTLKKLLRDTNTIETTPFRASRTCLLQYKSPFLDDITDLF